MPGKDDRAILARLREEYFDLLPDIRRVTSHLEAEIRYHTLPIFHSLAHYEQLIVKSRVKDCESALKSLRLDQEGGTFDPDRPEAYSILHLKDLAGVRVLVFPGTKLSETDSLLRGHFQDWTPKPVIDSDGKQLASKYFGYCTDEMSSLVGKVRAEYQVVPMLLGLFWEVEHSAIYKPSPSLLGIARSKEMEALRKGVEDALSEFESGFESLVIEGAFSSQHEIKT
jgi:ppGpp synthetase/RelA/SpoT-type nucleotidyltranferase